MDGTFTLLTSWAKKAQSPPPVIGGKHFKEVSMGSHIVNYDSMVALTLFKGHAMGGFGGSMKIIAIGCADGRI